MMLSSNFVRSGDSATPTLGTSFGMNHLPIMWDSCLKVDNALEEIQLELHHVGVLKGFF